MEKLYSQVTFTSEDQYYKKANILASKFWYTVIQSGLGKKFTIFERVFQKNMINNYYKSMFEKNIPTGYHISVGAEGVFYILNDGEIYISKLSTDKYEIFSLDINDPKKNIEIINNINMDIRSKDIQSLLKKINPKTIVHLAAQASVSISARDPQLDNDINLNGSLNLFIKSINSDLEKFIFFSTGGAIYGEEIGKKFNEH